MPFEKDPRLGPDKPLWPTDEELGNPDYEYSLDTTIPPDQIRGVRNRVSFLTLAQAPRDPLDESLAEHAEGLIAQERTATQALGMRPTDKEPVPHIITNATATRASRTAAQITVAKENEKKAAAQRARKLRHEP